MFRKNLQNKNKIRMFKILLHIYFAPFFFLGYSKQFAVISLKALNLH